MPIHRSTSSALDVRKATKNLTEEERWLKDSFWREFIVSWPPSVPHVGGILGVSGLTIFSARNAKPLFQRAEHPVETLRNG